MPAAVDSSGPEVVDLASKAGLHLDEWQRWVLDGMLGEDRAGRWAAFEAALIVPRQNGKNVILEALELAGLFLLGERVIIHSAHRFDTCTEHFMRMRELVEGTPDFSRRLARNGIVTANGKEAIKLANGARLKFVARQRGSGRGFTGNRIVFDEAYDLSPKAMGSMIPALAAKSMHESVQVVYTSSAPHDTSVVLHGLRDRGQSDNPGALFYAEWGNTPDVADDDRTAWYAANPSLGVWISEDFVEKERRSLESSPGEFARERLGVAEQPSEDDRDPKIDLEKWADSEVAGVVDARPGAVTIGWDVDLDGTSASIGIGADDLTSPYVELVEFREGAGWLGDRLVELVNTWNPIAVGCNAGGPAGAHVAAVLQAFRHAGIPDDRLTMLTAAEYRRGCGGLYADVEEGRLRRCANQEQLDDAVENATERTVGDLFEFDRRRATGPLSPLGAVTVARQLLPTEPVKVRPAVGGDFDADTYDRVLAETEEEERRALEALNSG